MSEKWRGLLKGVILVKALRKDVNGYYCLEKLRKQKTTGEEYGGGKGGGGSFWQAAIRWRAAEGPYGRGNRLSPIVTMIWGRRLGAPDDGASGQRKLIPYRNRK